jgi:precorrin-4/cobalt-precorrin-4 C11-methyltransferase
VTVHFVGAGPGAADLITVRAQRLLSECSVCLYAGSLIPEEILAYCPPTAALIDTADLTLDQITAAMVEADAARLDVVRLCSGDPAVFSAVAEQARRLDRAGVGYDITPGVPAFAAAAAALSRELTVPGVGQTVVLTRIAQRATPMPPGEDLASLGATGATLVLHLAVQRIEQVVAELVPHYGPVCPAAVVAYASQAREVVLRGTLGTIAAQVLAASVKSTAVIIVGKVLAAEGFRDSHLYSAERDRGSRAGLLGFDLSERVGSGGQRVPRRLPGGIPGIELGTEVSPAKPRDRGHSLRVLVRGLSRVSAGEVRPGTGAYELMRGIGNLCIGRDNDPRYDPAGWSNCS